MPSGRSPLELVAVVRVYRQRLRRARGWRSPDPGRVAARPGYELMGQASFTWAKYQLPGAVSQDFTGVPKPPVASAGNVNMAVESSA